MSNYQTISASLVALMPLIGALPQSAVAQPIDHVSTEPSLELTLEPSLQLSLEPTATNSIEAAANSPQTVITTQGRHTHIEGGVSANSNLFHRFDTFNVEAGHTANFVTSDSTQAVIGQVSGGNTSYIDGTLQVSGSDADLYLINPTGILFGRDAQLNLNGDLTATTADQIGFGDTWVDVANTQNYSQIAAEPSAYKFTSQTPGAVVNHADLAVEDGNAVRLIGGDVVNTGDISAPAGEITLTALPGESLVRLASAGSLLNLEVETLPDSVTPLALPELLTGEASPNATELQINDDGSVSLAGSVILTGELDVSSEAADETGGDINILGSSVEVYGADLYANGDAGGGLIRVGGDYQGQGTTPTAEQVSFTGTTAHANALTNGNGGDIILWSDGVTHFSGELSANGAGDGQGGLVETSGKEQLTFGDTTQVTTNAPSGELGTWLLDPVDLTVVSSSADVNASIIGGTNTPTESLIETGTITTALNFNNVTLQATNSITVNAVLNATGNATPGNLHLQADLLNLNEKIDLQGASTLTGTATTVNLGANGRLQDAVDAVATGGTINLSAVTYRDGETFIDRDVTLQGQTSSNTFISGENLHRNISIASGTTTINDITIQNGVADNGAGILVHNSGNLVLANSNFRDNVATSKGGALQLAGSGTTLIQNSQFGNNQGNEGGAIALIGTHSIIVEDSDFESNRSANNGGAIDINSGGGGGATVRRSNLLGNQASAKGGAVSLGEGYFVTEDSLFENNNTTSGDGGAIFGLSGTVTVANSTFRDNRATTSLTGRGGAIATINTLNVTDSHFDSNEAGTGGAIWLGGVNKISTISDTTLDSNLSQGNGGAIALQEEHSLTLNASTLSNNSATGEGGGAYNAAINANSLTINTSTFSGNNANFGGGLSTDFNAVTSLTHSTVANNTASFFGGGIINRGDAGGLSLRDSIVATNLSGTSNEISGSLTSGGYNLVSDRAGSSGYISTDLLSGLSADLAPLADNGGSIFTHALLSGSAAIDATNITLGLDSRGAAANGTRDIGAYERLPINELLFTAGDGQTTTVATAYTNPLEVQAIDALGGGLGGAPVGFLFDTSTTAPSVVLTSPGGMLTNSEGLATVSLSANTVAGPVSLTATSEGVSTNATLTNLAAAAANLTIVQGDKQSTVVDTSFVDLVAKVSDRFGNSIDGARIDFSVPTTGATGALSQSSDITGSSGEGRVGVTANTVAGTYDLTASSAGLSTTAALTNLAGAADSLTILQGDNQSTVVGTPFPEDLSVRVSDRFGNGISGIAANFSVPQPSGSPVNVAIATDSSGIFSMPIGASTITGTGIVEASAAGLTTNLTLTKLADVASRFVLGAHPTAVTAGDVNPFTVTAEDQFGNIADNYGGTVTFTSSDTQAQLPDNSLLINGVGNFISELRTAGNQSFVVTDTVNTNLSTTQDNITVSPAAAANIDIIAGNQQQSLIETSFTNDLMVEVRDRFGNPLIGETINFVAPASGASAVLDSPSVILDGSGQATTSLSANTQSGNYLVNAVIAGLSEAFNLENTLPSSIATVPVIEIATVPVIETDVPVNPLAPLAENSDDDGERGGRGDLFDEYAFSQLEQSLSEEYATYWQRPTKRGATLENIQQVLQQAGDEYKSRSAVVYAVFVPSNGTTDDETDMAYSSLLSRRLLTNDINNAQDELLLLLIPPEGNPIPQRVAISRRQLQRQAQLFNIELSSFFGEGYQPLAQQLYSWLLAPIENDIQSAGIDNLMYVLDEGLSTVPLAAMMTDDTFAIERYGLSVLPSVGLLQTDFGEDPADHTILAGGSETFSELESLPAVPVELDIIESTATSSQVLLNEDFSIDNLRQAHAQAPKSMMHVATHAAFNPGSADRSYVQFWEEQLKLEDIAELGLDDLELLILSACTTALGSRDAELGFAGLAAATGVEASIGSLWNVSDLGTMALMAEFYEQIQGSPLRFSALQQAQLSLLNGDTYIENNRLITQNSSVSIPAALVEQDINFRHPFFWSGFTLVGNPWW